MSPWRIAGLLGVALVLACASEPDPRDQRAATDTATPASESGRTYHIPISAGGAVPLVHRTSKPGELVLLELYSDKLVFTALVSRRVYEEVMALKPPTYFVHESLEYVRNDLLFWGPAGNPESVSVDGRVFDGFSLINKSQISAEGDTANAVLAAVRSGSRLKLEKHYWDSVGEKAFPSYEISPIRARLSDLSASASTGFTVSEDETRCRVEGPRKIVWIESAAGSFALNGPALEQVDTRQSSGNPWLDQQGRPVGKGLDILGPDVTQNLIQAGLRTCGGA